jgi:hypothetical protein
MRIALPLLLSVLPACKDGVLTTIDIEDSAITEVEGATILETLVGDLGFESFVSMNLVESEELQNQGVEPGDIKNARLVEFELEAMSPSGADLSFIEEMAILVESPGLPEETLASADAFPEGQALVVFDVQDVDLTDYIVSESLTLSTDVTGRRPDETTIVEARYRIEVGVTLQGVKNNR